MWILLEAFISVRGLCLYPMQMHYHTNTDLIPEKLKEIHVTVDRLCPHVIYIAHRMRISTVCLASRMLTST